MAEVIVAGAGLAGLVTTRRLAAAGHDVTVIERWDAVGGRVRSRERDGFVLDRGFQVLFEGYPAVQRELDVAALDPQPFDPGAVIVRDGGRSVYGDPQQSPSLLPSTLMNPEVPLRDTWRLFRLQRSLAGASMDELLDGDVEGRGADGTRLSIREYLREWGVSNTAIEAFFEPFVGGVTLDRSLSADAGLFRAVFAMLSRGRTVLPADGMGSITRYLADQSIAAGVDIEIGTAVTDVSSTDDGVTLTAEGETLTADAAIIATDPPTARELTGVDAIPTEGAGCVTVYVSLPSGSAPGMGSRLILNADGDGPDHVAPLSRIAPSYAPQGAHLYSATFLGDPDESDEELFHSVRRSLGEWYPEARFAELSLVAVDRIDFAQFAQPPGFRADLPATDAPDGPVFLAGEYTRWSSIQGALESGRQAALAVDDAV